MPITNVADLVENWSGFEDLVAELHASGEVTVERDVKLKGKSGAERQVDVLIRHKVGFYEHLIVIECKYLKRRVARQVVDAMITTVDDLNASKGVIFTNRGFQKGALILAKQSGIELYEVRDVALDVRGPRYKRAVYRVAQFCLLGLISVYKDKDGREVEERWLNRETPVKDADDLQVDEETCDLTGRQIRTMMVDVYKQAMIGKNPSTRNTLGKSTFEP